MAVFKRRWLMWDFARQRRFDREEFSLVATKLAELGYNGIGLYLEGAFAFKNLGGGILREGVMTYDDALWIKEKCESLGIFVFPMTNVVGHMEHFLRQERFKYLKTNEASKRYDIDFKKPEAEEFAMKIIHEFTDAFDIKYVHIGGDEVELTPETKPVYAEFLAKLCDNLLAEGIKPAIWNDMIWANKELCEPFSRDVEIFDWHYFGHRTESHKFFKEKGFKDVVACPCENSWVGFINHQFVAWWAKSEKIPVKPYEIEAFLADQVANEDDQTNLQGLITHWEATQGRDLWGQWSALARAGLYMKGELEAGEQNDEALEKALFGRVTPYTELTNLIQEEIHGAIINPGVTTVSTVGNLRRALFTCPQFIDTVNKLAVDGAEYHDAVNTATEKAEKWLKAWEPQNEFEKHCVVSMNSILSMIRAANALSLAAASCKEYYTAAAELQFTEPQKAKELVHKFADGFKAVNERITAYKGDLKKLIDCTGHSDTDLIKLDITMDNINRIVACLEDYASEDKFKKLPLPTFKYVVEWAVNRDILER